MVQTELVQRNFTILALSKIFFNSVRMCLILPPNCRTRLKVELLSPQTKVVLTEEPNGSLS